MSSVTRLHRPQIPAPQPASPRLGPAEVLRGGPAVVDVRLSDGSEREAKVALAFTYEPAVGDTVLVISDEGGSYVIGVLSGQGKGVLAFPGDFEVRAAGKLRLTSGEGVAIEGPRMDVRVGSLTLLARTVSERFDSLKQRVVDLLSVQAGKVHTVVEGESFTRAESSTLLTKDKVSINGKAIHLG